MISAARLEEWKRLALEPHRNAPLLAEALLEATFELDALYVLLRREMSAEAERRIRRARETREVRPS